MVIGWDIGGVNTKIARVVRGVAAASTARPFELQRAPAALVPLLRELAACVGAVHPDGSFPCAATMTAELSQMFRRKADGVAFVVDALEAAFPNADVRIFSVRGDFLSPGEARRRPLEVAAANWAATAAIVARRHHDALLIDIGTTTTDIIPIAGGAVVAAGLTDPDRLASGELVYTGAVRTPVEAIVHDVPLGDGVAGVSAEGFALAGDVHVWRGTLPA
ncbi:MAG TPA: hydantoinase/oxoprolinase family protein, partial [Vicinamibacterales bacterium]|nr:hydantoinase/oxoprolinase family protein [Vicinamibacterales bacterium]